MDINFECYPENYDSQNEDPTYFVEFSQWDGQPERWRLFKRHFNFLNLIYGTNFEGHPWNLAEGEVAMESIISLDNKGFLKFLVDALNEKVKREESGENKT